MLELKEIRIGMSGVINTGNYQSAKPSAELTFAVLGQENWDEAIQRACNLTHDALMWDAKRLLVNADDDLRERWLRQLGGTASITVQTVELTAEDEAVMNLALMETMDDPFDDDDDDESDDDFDEDDDLDDDDFDDAAGYAMANADERLPDEGEEDADLPDWLTGDGEVTDDDPEADDAEDTKEVIVPHVDKVGADF